VAEFDPAPSNVCIRDRKIPDRSNLVVLSLLDPKLLSRHSRTRSHHDWSTIDSDLSDRRHRQYWRWVALIDIYQARLDHQSFTQNGDVDMCTRSYAHHLRREREEPLGSGRFNRSCCGGASGLVV